MDNKRYIEMEILKLISEHPSCTPFLIRQEFNSRQHNLVKEIINDLLKSGKIKYDESNLYLKIVVDKS